VIRDLEEKTLLRARGGSLSPLGGPHPACLTGMLSGWSGGPAARWPSVPRRISGRMERLFTTVRWDEDVVRDDLRGYVAATLGNPDGVLIGADTVFEKKGSQSAGVQRQYTGTAREDHELPDRVLPGYAGPKGRALMDRELCLPRSWTGDDDRLARRPVTPAAGAGR
jgi:hypothetical protein